MNRRENRLHLLEVAEPVRFGERRTPHGVVHAECRVQDDSRLLRLLHVQVRVVDADGPHRHAKAAPHASDHRIEDGHQDAGVQQIIFPTVPGAFLGGLPIGLDKHPQDKEAEQHQIPVVQCFMEDDSAQVIVALELLEHRPGGPSAGEREIHAVAQVRGKNDEIGNYVQPLGDAPIYTVSAKTERQEHQDDVNQVRIESRRQVKAPSRPAKACQARQIHVRKQRSVQRKENQPAAGKDDHHQQKVPQDSADI